MQTSIDAYEVVKLYHETTTSHEFVHACIGIVDTDKNILYTYWKIIDATLDLGMPNE